MLNRFISQSIHPSKKPPQPLPCPASLVPRRSSPCLRLWVHVDNPPHAATLVGLELDGLMVPPELLSCWTWRKKTGSRAMVDWFMLIVSAFDFKPYCKFFIRL